VNDLIKGNADETVITNYQKLIDELKTQHPKAEIVVQSLLPHGGDRLTVDDREQVLKVSNERIVQINRKLQDLATQQEVKFLDLYPVFVDAEGLLRSDLSTDGLHLNPQGYTSWQAALQTFDQLALQQPATAKPAAADAAAVEAEATDPKAEATAETPVEAPAEAAPKSETAVPKAEAVPPAQ
jgi:lysophospholipase L1-like esterase